METVSVAHLDKLKGLVRARVRINTQDDCFLIQRQIAGAVGVFISEIAIQRLFGFMPGKFLPSLYTLDVLSRFCGYDSWQAFCSKYDHR